MRRRQVAIVGNCQASAIANLYRDFVGGPASEDVRYFDDYGLPPENVRAAVADADLVIVQERDFNHGLNQADVPAGVTVQAFPMVLAGFLWPYANEPHVCNVPEPPFSDGPYPSQLSDSFLNRLIVKGASAEDALEEYLAHDIARATHADRMFEIYMDRQASRDERTGFALSPLIEASYRDECLFRTPNHPNAHLFGLVAAQLFERLDVPGETIAAAQRSLFTTPFPPDELPIHPGIARHFGLTYASPDRRYSYFDEGAFTFEEYVQRYMRYENNHELRQGIALAFDDPVRAIDLLNAGLARSPGSVRGWRSLGIAYDRLGRLNESLPIYQQALALQPDLPESHVALSRSRLIAGDLDAALAAADQAVGLAPNYAPAHTARTEVLIRRRAEGAAESGRAACALLPSFENMHLLGRSLAAEGRLQEAEDVCRRLVAREPTSPDARNLLAEVLEDLGRRAEAIALLEEELPGYQPNAQSFSLLGNFFLRDNVLDRSEAAFARGVGLDPSRPDLEQCRADVAAKRLAAAGTVERDERGSLAQSGNSPARGQAAAAHQIMSFGEPPRIPHPQAYWLPEPDDWRADIAAIEAMTSPGEDAWQAVQRLAMTRLDFVRTERLDRSISRLWPDAPPPGLRGPPIRMAALGSANIAHLMPAIRVAAARRGLWITVFEGDYGQYRQELLDPASALYRFAPTVVLLSLDARHVLGGADARMSADDAERFSAQRVDDLAALWSLVGQRLGVPVIQQTLMPVFPDLMGSNEARLPGGHAALVSAVNAAMIRRAEAAHVDLLDMDRRCMRDGLGGWHDPLLWHRAKQEITPAAAPVYGDLVARLLAARMGLSAKALVLDLDNTLWGGVIGDDGVDNIVLGAGSAAGEAFVDVQAYAAGLGRRGIILAICSKNDEAVALDAFENHPGMVLHRSDIAAFRANWVDKATNIRAIAEELSIGLDSLVFVDDNPFERNLVRQALPQVMVPNLPEEPALFARCLSDAGYFESLSLTDEDRNRASLYQQRQERQALAAEATDVGAYLRSLDMKLVARPFDPIGVKRIAQLINKTNQFNLTTRRYDERDVRAIMEDPDHLGLQLQLVDRLGDNGIIAVVIGRLEDDRIDIDTWLMSCRVLGREVEAATLKILVGEAQRRGAARLIGRYRPTHRNGMVADLYERLGFAPVAQDGDERVFALDLAGYVPAKVPMEISAL